MFWVMLMNHDEEKKDVISKSRWWGDYEVGKNKTLRWQIGPKILWISRDQQEWRIASIEAQDLLDSRLIVAETTKEPNGDDIDVWRFAVQSESNTVRLVPALPDRPLVVKTTKPIYLPSMEEAILFVSIPLWLRIYVGEGSVDLMDSAIVRPSDTWFGPNTMKGDLCYASQTSARLHIENLPLRPHRSITSVRIRNNSTLKLHIERLKIPVNNLSLFSSEKGHLWTEALTLERVEDTDRANVQLDKKPTLIKESTLVTQPRTKISKGFLLDAFGGLLAWKKGEIK
jgi:hypothetical protein